MVVAVIIIIIIKFVCRCRVVVVVLLLLLLVQLCQVSSVCEKCNNFDFVDVSTDTDTKTHINQ